MGGQSRARLAAWSVAGLLVLTCLATVAVPGGDGVRAAAPTATAVTPRVVLATATPPPLTPTPSLFGPHGDTYTNPTYGWTIHWDPGTWTNPARERESGIELGVTLYHGTAAADGTYPFRFYAETLDQADSDVFAFVNRDNPEHCLQGYADWAGGQQQTDPQGKPLRGVSPDRAWAVFANTRNGDNAVYVECRTLVPQKALILFLAIGPGNAQAQLVPMAQKIVATLTIPKSGTWTPTPIATAPPGS